MNDHPPAAPPSANPPASPPPPANPNVATGPDRSNASGEPGTAPRQVLEYAAPRLLNPPNPLFTVGTLTYTTGGLVVLFFWLLLGDFAFSMRERSAHPAVQMLLKQYGASATFMSLLLAVVPSAVSMMLGPIISFKSDRYRSRWGRRIPFLFITTPITFVSMMGLALSPRIGVWADGALGASSPGLNACVLWAFAIFYTAFEFATITSLVLFGALVNDVVPRAVIGRFFGLFRAVSLGAGMIFNYWLISWAETHFFEIFLVISLLFGVGFTVMCLGVKEGEYPPPTENPNDVRGRGFFAAAETYFRECFTSKYYLWVFGAMLMASLTFMPFNTFSLPYAKALCMKTADYGFWITISYTCSLVLSYPLGWLVDRFHPLRMGILAMALYAISTAYGALYVNSANTFAVALVAHTILSGTYFTATAALGALLFPKLKFGQYASAAQLVASLGSIAVGLMLGPTLDLSARHTDLAVFINGIPMPIWNAKLTAWGLTFWAGLILCLLTLVSLISVYIQFMRRGGPKGYVAPEIQS